ncbi:hypothetical protein B0H19DRAFT_1061217 [Mycena capillaripes]|nr:hypothetical protein B0H19DRAFT_1061217 [Mycena capillaripes]
MYEAPLPPQLSPHALPLAPGRGSKHDLRTLSTRLLLRASGVLQIVGTRIRVVARRSSSRSPVRTPRARLPRTAYDFIGIRVPADAVSVCVPPPDVAESASAAPSSSPVTTSIGQDPLSGHRTCHTVARHPPGTRSLTNDNRASSIEILARKMLFGEWTACDVTLLYAPSLLVATGLAVRPSSSKTRPSKPAPAEHPATSSSSPATNNPRKNKHGLLNSRLTAGPIARDLIRASRPCHPAIIPTAAMRLSVSASETKSANKTGNENEKETNANANKAVSATRANPPALPAPLPRADPSVSPHPSSTQQLSQFHTSIAPVHEPPLLRNSRPMLCRLRLGGGATCKHAQHGIFFGKHSISKLTLIGKRARLSLVRDPVPGGCPH